MSRKTRILLVGEFTALATGYSTYGREVMKRLHATGKYELAELASYGNPTDLRRLDLPWGYLPNSPDETDREQVEKYLSAKVNEFGEWRFEEACLSFKPDIVWSFRDWWMDEFIERSPYRPFFHWAHMPTLDGEPLDDQWLSTYQNCDAVFGYSDWGLDLLKRQTNGTAKTHCSAPPGADIDLFKPMNKTALKQEMGLPADAIVIGTVMRNQPRKLYPDLIEAFAQYLREAPEHLAARSYLYLHTGFPDLGWNLPRLIKEAGVGNKTLLTYVCKSCGHSYPNFYQDAVAPCRVCKEYSAKLTDSNKGVSRAILAKTLNLMDIYVQYSTCEGFGMPQVEAASCGVPVAAVDYSAMSDVVRKVGGYPIKVQRFFREVDTHRFLAMPDNGDLVRFLIKFLGQPEPLRLRAGFSARQGVLENYTYDRTAKIWEEHFDSVVQRPLSATWGSPIRQHIPAKDLPMNLSDEQFVKWCISQVAGRPDLADSYMAMRMARDLAWGATAGGTGGLAFNDLSAMGAGLEKHRRPYTRDDVLNQLLNIAERQNYWETRRMEGVPK